MKIVITGSTGMVGKGVLLVALADERVEHILLVNRSPVGISHPKIKEILLPNFNDIHLHQDELAGYDACFFCMGVSSFRLSEKTFTALTYDLAVHFASTFVKASPASTFIYVSGTGTDSTEKGNTMWARVKGRTENAILAMPFKAAYMFRPGFIQPMRGIKSKTKLYQSLYTLVTPIYPIINKLFGKYITTTDKVGQAMLNLTAKGSTQKHFENADINQWAKA